MYRYLIVLALTSIAGLQAWRTLFNNFAVDEAFLDGFGVGLIQSVRELPGFLTFFVIYFLIIFKEHRFSAVSIIVMGLGMAATGFFPNLQGLLIMTFIFSLGFHYFETTNRSLTLQHFSGKEAPMVLARYKSFGAIINIIVGIIIWLITSAISLTFTYVIFGLIILVIGTVALFQKPVLAETTPQKKRVVLRKKYWLYYVLSFLSGARRQIFVVFAVFMLVKKYHFSVQHIAILFVINNLLTFFIFPYIARGINRFGERRMLSIEYASLFFIFIGYALIESPFWITVLYVLDHVFFGFAIGIETFYQKIANKEDIAQGVGTAYTINHISAVIVPVVGGSLWMLDWRIPFIAGAVLCIISFYFVRQIRSAKLSK